MTDHLNSSLDFEVGIDRILDSIRLIGLRTKGIAARNGEIVLERNGHKLLRRCCSGVIKARWLNFDGFATPWTALVRGLNVYNQPSGFAGEVVVGLGGGRAWD